MSTDDLYDKLDPYKRTKWQQMTIATTPRITGSISFIASTIMIYMILRSDIKLDTPFRRIIFAMCIVDLLQSSSVIVSTAASPKDTPGIWGAMGNTTTCDISGWIFQFSSTVPPMYICSLSIHYFFFVQYKIKHTTFSKRIEPFLHGVPILLSIFDATYLVATEHINNADVVCWNASSPYNCVNDPEIECDRGENTYLLRAIFNAAPNFIALNLTIAVMTKTYMIYKAREKRDGKEEYIVDGEEVPKPSLPQDSTAVKLEKETTNRGSGMVRRGTTFNGPPSTIKSSNGISSSTAGNEEILTSDSEPVKQTNGRGSGMVRRGVTFSPPPPSSFSSSGVSSGGAGRVSTTTSEHSEPGKQINGQGSSMMTRRGFNFKSPPSDFSSSGVSSGRDGGVSTTSDLEPVNETTDGRRSGAGGISAGPSSNMSSERKLLSSSKEVKEKESHHLPSSRHSSEVRSPANEEQRRRDKIRFRSKEALTQSYLFIGSFGICYIFIYIAGSFEFFKLDTPYFITLAMWIFFPLQGFFNIIVFTRPHVVELKKAHKDLTKWQAIWMVIKSGGDSAIKARALQYETAFRADNQESGDDPDGDGSSRGESRPLSNILEDGAVVSSLAIDEGLFQDDLISEQLYGDNDYDIYNDDFYDDEAISLDPENLEDNDGISLGTFTATKDT